VCWKCNAYEGYQKCVLNFCKETPFEECTVKEAERLNDNINIDVKEIDTMVGIKLKWLRIVSTGLVFVRFTELSGYSTTKLVC